MATLREERLSVGQELEKTEGLRVATGGSVVRPAAGPDPCRRDSAPRSNSAKERMKICFT